MPCVDAKVLTSYREGRLDDETSLVVEAHLADCVRCHHATTGEANPAFVRHGMEYAPTVADAAASQSAPSLATGTALGRYVVLQMVGAGGMGVVYAAFDPHLDRKVALKLLHPSGSTIENGLAQHRRLLREARAMARLAHPNVVVVHDVGVIEGRVFVATEFVEGLTLADWLARGPRSQAEILAVFLQAGRGLASAHAAHLVHRDFKPDNVLVGHDGRARVTDFGLARAPESTPAVTPPPDEYPAPQATGSGLEPPITRVGMILGTPEYMAPEQHRGGPTDGRTDQFSFCVALYEALYGERPFAGSRRDLARAVTEGRIRPPSKGNVPAWLRAALLRGLQVSPDARWPSMDALLAALERHPAIRRRRIAVIASALALLVGGGALAGKAAHQEAAICRGANASLGGAWNDDVRARVHAAFESTQAPFAEDAWRAVERSLGGYTAAWISQRTEACEATRVRGEQSDEVLTLRMQCLDRRLTELRAAVDLFAHADKGVVQRAATASASLTPLAGCSDVAALVARVRPPDDPAARKAVEAIRERLQHAHALLEGGKIKEGLEEARPLVVEAQSLRYRPIEAEALTVRAKLELEQGDAKASRATLEEAVSAAEAGHHDEVAAEAWALLVLVLGVHLDQVDAATEAERRARAALERIGGASAAAYLLPDAIGQWRHGEGKDDLAVVSLREALAIAEERYGSDHPITAQTLGHLAMARSGRDDFEGAVNDFQRSIDTLERWVGREHPALAKMKTQLGYTYSRRGDFVQARRLSEEALAIQERVYGTEHPEIQISLNSLAVAMRMSGDLEGALSVVGRALAVARAVSGPEHTDIALTLHHQGSIQETLGKNADARRSYEQALAMAKKTLGEGHVFVSSCLASLGHVALSENRGAEARSHYTAALRINEKVHAPDDPDLARDLVGLGLAHLSLHDTGRALPLLERALRLRESREMPPARLAEAQFALARALAESRRGNTRARELAERARANYGRAGAGFARALQHVETWQRSLHT